MNSLALLALALPLVATAASPWRVDPAGSSLGFTAIQAGARFDGHFERFSAIVDFDPAEPAAGRFDVRVDLGSVTTREAERDGILKGVDFFATARFPEARYVASDFRRDGDGYLADGKLTLRGITHPLRVRFRFTPDGADRARLSGGARLSRLAFGVGQGEWQDTEWVGDEVEVRFDLLLER